MQWVKEIIHKHIEIYIIYINFGMSYRVLNQEEQDTESFTTASNSLMTTAQKQSSIVSSKTSTNLKKKLGTFAASSNLCRSSFVTESTHQRLSLHPE